STGRRALATCGSTGYSPFNFTWWSRGACHAIPADLRRQPYRPDLLPTRAVVIAGSSQVEAPRSPRGGAGGRPPLVRGGPRPGDVERGGTPVPEVPGWGVSPCRRDEGPWLRVG